MTPLTKEEIDGPEIWRVWPRDTRFAVSSHGRIVGVQGKPIGDVNAQGYLRICARVKGKAITHRVHHIVAETFIPRPEGATLVRHLDDCRTNNHVNNLAWGTHADNVQDAIRNGRLRPSRTPDANGLLRCSYCELHLPKERFSKQKRSLGYECHACASIRNRNKLKSVKTFADR